MIKRLNIVVGEVEKDGEIEILYIGRSREEGKEALRKAVEAGKHFQAVHLRAPRGTVKRCSAIKSRREQAEKESAWQAAVKVLEGSRAELEQLERDKNEEDAARVRKSIPKLETEAEKLFAAAFPKKAAAREEAVEEASNEAAEEPAGTSDKESAPPAKKAAKGKQS